MSGGEVRRVSREDIQLVQNLIERCLQLYMNQKEVVETLLVQAKIEPGFTELVWQKLEEENREFFRAYHLRLIVKQQIMIFNKLLEEQVELMHKSQAGVASLPNSNGSHTSQLHQTSACYAPKHTGPPFRPENLHNPSGPAVPNALINGGQSMHSRMNTVDSISAQTGRMEVPPNILSTQSSHVGMIQGMNGIMIKSEPGYSSSSAFTFGPDGDVLETRPTIGDASVTSFSSMESSSQPLHDPMLDTDISSFGFLGQIPRNFSLSDLTADFSQSSDILESYSRSPYLASNTDNFLDSPGRAECHGDSKKLDTISEGLSYEEFGSD